MTHHLGDAMKGTAPRSMLETEVIGALILDPGRVSEIRSWLLPEHFESLPLRSAFEAVLAAPPSDRVANICLVAERIEAGPAEREAAMKAMLDATRTVTSTAYLLHFAERLAGIETIAQIGKAGGQIKADADEADPFSAKELLAESRARIDEINPPTGTTTARTLELRRGEVEEVEAIPTGNPDLDRLLSGGGFRPGQLIVIAAASGVGKSTLMATLACKTPRVPLFVSLEMSEVEVRRMIHEDGWSRILFTDEARTLDEIEVLARAAQRQKGITHVFVDYLQIIDAGPRANRSDSREQEVAGIARRLKELAASCHLIVVTGSQVNEDGKTRESRAIEQSASVLLLMEESDADRERTVRIEKQRSGEKGKVIRLHLCTNPLRFEPKALGIDLMAGPASVFDKDDDNQKRGRRSGYDWSDH